MEKAIILLSGTPDGKNKFIDIAKSASWLWNINARDFLGSKSSSFYWSGERNEDYYKFTSEFLGLVNKYFEFEEKYLREKIERFLSDDSTEKRHGDKSFEKFILIVHGVSKNIVQTLMSDYGVFKVHISRRDLNSNIESHDLTLYEDDENFDEEVAKVINTLAK